jgi:F0F1-type ATP synthase gamma subunit
MSRERVLRRRLHVLGTLHEAVGALRSLSAHHFRAARAALPAARTYRAEVEATLGVLPELLRPEAEARGESAILLVSADLGLCGDYAARLATEAARARASLGQGPFWCVGRRAVRPLAHAGITPDRVWPGAAGTASLPRLLVPLVNEIVAAREAGRLRSLVIVAARFDGAGRFVPTRNGILPVTPPAGAPPLRPSPYAGPAHLAAVLVREFLYVALHETLLDALAAEHGKRLVVAEGARGWLEQRRHATARQLGAVRRETTTQEVLEVATGARMLRRGAGD